MLDRCIDDGIRFDYCIGVSAGSANVAAFLAGQKGRNLRFYADYSARPAFMGLGALRASGSFLAVGYVYGTLSQDDGEDPLDVAAGCEAGVPCELLRRGRAFRRRPGGDQGVVVGARRVQAVPLARTRVLRRRAQRPDTAEACAGRRLRARCSRADAAEGVSQKGSSG